MYEAARNLSCLFWLKFEPFFGKIPTPTFDCLPPAAAGKNRSPASRDRQAGKNSFPLKPLSFLPACFEASRGNSARSAEKIKMGYLLYSPRCLPRFLFFYFLLLLFFHLQIPMLGYCIDEPIRPCKSPYIPTVLVITRSICFSLCAHCLV